jgi:hypothetical protein
MNEQLQFAQDLINALTQQRNDAFNAMVQLQAQNAALSRKLAELQNVGKTEETAE